MVIGFELSLQGAKQADDKKQRADDDMGNPCKPVAMKKVEP